MDKKNYKLLMQKTKSKNEDEKFEIVNEQIEEILTKVPNKMHTLEALICKFESETNIGPYFSAMTIAYAVLMGAVTIMPFDSIHLMMSVLLIVISLYLAIDAVRINKLNKRMAFVLQALKFRYEKEKHIINNSKESVNILRDITSEEK